MKIITISGLDGSGKSTQIQLLKNYLEQNGSKVFYFHAVEFSLANKLSKKNKSGESKSVTSATPFQIWLRRIFLRIDIWRFKSLHSKLCNENYDYILSDRYFYDTAVNIEYLEKTCRGREFAFRKKERMYAFPTPNVAIYLQTEPENIMSRNRIPDQGMEYLQNKKELYDIKTSIWNWKVIDGNQEKEEIFEEIKNLAIK